MAVSLALAFGRGLAGGADAILIPELPYDVQVVAESIRARTRQGKRFSIVAVAEGALSKSQAGDFAAAVAEVIAEGENVTYDLKPAAAGSQAVGTSQVADAVIEKLKGSG